MFECFPMSGLYGLVVSLIPVSEIRYTLKLWLCKGALWSLIVSQNLFNRVQCGYCKTVDLAVVVVSTSSKAIYLVQLLFLKAGNYGFQYCVRPLTYISSEQRRSKKSDKKILGLLSSQ